MTVCNMSIEAGARAGMVAPDETTFAYLEGRAHAPRERTGRRRVDDWRALASDPGATYDTHVVVDVDDLVPQVTWGTNPGMVVPVTGSVPDPATYDSADDRAAAERALAYMDLRPGTRIEDIPLDRVFIGSCTNARIEDLRAAASVVAGRTVDARVKALVVPGSASGQADRPRQEGLDRVFLDAGFEWRVAGCSMCLGMNPDILQPGERCAVDLQPQLRGPPGPRRPHAPRQPADGRGGSDPRPLRGRPHARLRAGRRMKPVRAVSGRVAVLDRPDVDTDQIIPKQFLKRIERTGYGPFAFFDWRYDEDGAELPDFELNRPQFSGASVLLAGRNFGCGSSREHAAWALSDYGFGAIIAPSFGDIFRTNAGKNGLLAIILPAEEIDRLMESVDLDKGSEMTVDLERLVVVAPDGREVPFEFDESTRHRLLNGLDDIALTLRHEDAIAAFETAHGIQ